MARTNHHLPTQWNFFRFFLKKLTHSFVSYFKNIKHLINLKQEIKNVGRII